MKKIEEYAEQAEESFNNHVDNIPDGDIPLLPDETSIKVAEFNEKQATDILKEAHITPENPNYKKYLGLTEANVHTWRRFSTYDNTVREMLIETLSNPEMTIEQYQEATKRFRVDQIELQQLNASGSTFNGTVDESYPALMLNEDAAVQEGIKIRKRLGTTYPSVFYEEGSSLPNRRVIAVIEDESAYGIVDAYAAKHSTNGLKLVVEVDNEGKEFVKITDAQGRVQSPGSFFNGRINEIDNFLGKSELDFTDEELFNCLEKGDYDGFMELRKTRGKNRNKTNLAMRNLLNQRKDLFNEVCEVYRKAGGDPEKFMQGIQKLKERYAHNVEVIAAETNYGALAKPKGKIDRVMFSVRPADLAQQSTFQNWKSCMNAAGLNHRYVKETIGRGSIIAYGYSSENPAQMVSRILINPYENEKGEIIYRANRAMYGQPNSAFRKTVEQLVEQEFNNPEAQGIFRRNPYLYPDGDPGCIFKIRNKGVLTIKRGEVFDFEGVKYPKDWRLTIEGDCTIKNLKEMPKTLTCAKGSNIFFENCVNLTNIDLSQCESVTIRENCNLKGTKLPKYVVFENVDISGLDLSQCEHVTISGGCNLKGTKLPKYVVFDNVDISGLDLSQCEHVTISGDCNLKGTNLSKNVTICDAKITAGTDLTKIENLSIEGDIFIGEDVKFRAGTDLSKCDWLHIEGKCDLSEVKLPEKLYFDNVDISGMDLSNHERISISGKCNLTGTKFPKQVFFNSIDVSGMDLSQCEHVTISGDCNLKGTKFPKDVVFCGVDISGMDLSQCEQVTISNECNLTKTKLPKNVTLRNYTVSEKLNLSGRNVTIDGNIRFNNNVVLKDADVTLHSIEYIIADINDTRPIGIVGISNIDLTGAKSLNASGTIIVGKNVKLKEGTDFSQCTQVIIGEECNLNKVKLPKNMYFDATNFSTNIDLSMCEEATFYDCTTTKGAKVKLPNEVCFVGSIPEGADFSQCKKLRLEGVHNIPENLKLPDIEIEVSENCSLGVRERIQRHNAAVREKKLATRVSDTPTQPERKAPSLNDDKAPTSAEGEPPTLRKEGKAKTPVEEKASTLPENRVTNKEEPTTPKENVGTGRKAGKSAAEATGENAGKTAAKAATATATESAAKTASKNWFLRFNAWYDKWFFDKPYEKIMGTKVVKEGLKKPWVQATEKAVAKPFHWTGKGIEKAAAKFAETESGKAIAKKLVEKGITKEATKVFGKSAAKKIPLICFFVGCYYAYERWQEDDKLGAAGEFISGLVANIPGYGTAASLGIDGALLKRDLTGSFLSINDLPMINTLKCFGNAIDRAEIGDLKGVSVEMWLSQMSLINPMFGGMMADMTRELFLDPLPQPKTLEEEVGDAFYLASTIYTLSMFEPGADPEKCDQMAIETLEKAREEIISRRAQKSAKTIAMNKARDELSAARREELTNPAIAPRDTFYDNPSVRAAENMRVMDIHIDPEVYAREYEKIQEEVDKIFAELEALITEEDGEYENESDNGYENNTNTGNNNGENMLIAEPPNKADMYPPYVRQEIGDEMIRDYNNLQEDINRMPNGNLNMNYSSEIWPEAQDWLGNKMMFFDERVNMTNSFNNLPSLTSGKPSWMDPEIYQNYQERQEKRNIWKENWKKYGPMFVPWWRSDGKDY